MNINNELLAAYAEGNVSQEERQSVRQYLMEHPQELESVAMMMDEDYDLEVEESTQPKSENLTERVFYFSQDATIQDEDDIHLKVASCISPMSFSFKKKTFDDRLNDLLTEL